MTFVLKMRLTEEKKKKLKDLARTHLLTARILQPCEIGDEKKKVEKKKWPVLIMTHLYKAGEINNQRSWRTFTLSTFNLSFQLPVRIKLLIGRHWFTFNGLITRPDKVRYVSICCLLCRNFVHYSNCDYISHFEAPFPFN